MSTCLPHPRAAGHVLGTRESPELFALKGWTVPGLSIPLWLSFCKICLTLTSALQPPDLAHTRGQTHLYIRAQSQPQSQQPLYLGLAKISLLGNCLPFSSLHAPSPGQSSPSRLGLYLAPNFQMVSPRPGWHILQAGHGRNTAPRGTFMWNGNLSAKLVLDPEKQN